MHNSAKSCHALMVAVLVAACDTAAGSCPSADAGLDATDVAADAESGGFADGSGIDAGSFSDASDTVDDGASLEPVGGRAARACIDDPACVTPIVVAHRALHTAVPENSLAAIRATAGAGIPFAEIDVQVSADGFAVVMHDGSVDRTTTGTGSVSAMTLREIADLELVGADPNDPETQRVPTFTEALALAQELDVAIYLDLKTSNWAPVLADIEAADAWERVLMRDDVERLVEMRAQAPELWVLAPVTDAAEAGAAQAALPGLTIVELVAAAASPATTSEIASLGLKVQQDVIAAGDLVFDAGAGGAGWQTFVDAGVQLLQSDRPVDLLSYLAQ